jgi:hypothetical protein
MGYNYVESNYSKRKNTVFKTRNETGSRCVPALRSLRVGLLRIRVSDIRSQEI